MTIRDDGLMQWNDPGADKPLFEIKTIRCCHCGGHFPEPSFDQTPQARALRKGRGYCMNCDGFICGAKCQECVPLERGLEIMEGTRKEDAVTVAGNLWLPGG